MVANSITVSRMLFSLALLVFSPCSALFAAFYLLCGATDVLDGFAARKLHTESEKGAKLDSAADLLFLAVCVIKIVPLLHLPGLLWVLIAVIAAVKLVGMLLRLKRCGEFLPPHSLDNRLTGILLFLLPLTLTVVDARYSVAVVCAFAAFAAVRETVCALHNRD